MPQSRESIRRVARLMRQVGQDALDLMLPARCQLCDAPASARFDRVLCEGCAEGWPTIEAGCPHCGRPGEPVGQACVECAAEPPPFERARALTWYEGKPAEAVQALKYAGRRGLAPLLGRLMGQAIPELLGEPCYRAVVPIPLHWRRRWWRGYNQAELLAAPIARQLGIPMELDLSRGRASKAQAHLGLRERRQNIARVFSVSPAAARRLQGGDILLIDDVFTTGATTGACALSLKAAGVNRVDVLTLARTP